jgi:hypothetical protein
MEFLLKCIECCKKYSVEDFCRQEVQGEFQCGWNELGKVELRHNRRSGERGFSVYRVIQQQENHVFSDP